MSEIEVFDEKQQANIRAKESGN
jgi:hypothetical protein